MARAAPIVTCSGGNYFDRHNYVNVHIPVALAYWHRHGRESASAFFPRVSEPKNDPLGICRYRDANALRAGLALPDTAAVMADVARFTDAAVKRILGTLL